MKKCQHIRGILLLIIINPNMKKHNYGIQKGDILLCLLPLPKGIISEGILIAQSLKVEGGKYSHAVLCKSNTIAIDARAGHGVKYIPVSHYVNGDYNFMIKRPIDQSKVDDLVKNMENDIGKKYGAWQNVILVLYLLVYKFSFRKLDLFKIFPHDMYPDEVNCIEVIVDNCRKSKIEVEPKDITSNNFLPVYLQLDNKNFFNTLEVEASS